MYMAGKQTFIIGLATAGFVKETAGRACECGYIYTMAKLISTLLTSIGVPVGRGSVMMCTSGSLTEVEHEIQDGMDMSLRTN